MQLSSPRFKSFAVTAGFSFWFFIITNSLDLFSIEIMITFTSLTLIVTQIFASKLSKILDVFAIINTKIFLGLLFVSIISIYGILFRLLKIDLLRLKKQKNSYWLEVEQTKHNRIRKQY
jgi:hypothetical protein